MSSPIALPGEKACLTNCLASYSMATSIALFFFVIEQALHYIDKILLMTRQYKRYYRLTIHDDSQDDEEVWES